MRRLVTVLSTGLMTLTLLAGVTLAAEQPRLGTAGDYAVMAATAISNTGPTVINGNLAISPSDGSSVTGFPPGVVTGESDLNNADAIGAQVDLVTAYNDAAAEVSTVNLSGSDLGGMTLTPGVYTFDSSAQLTGTLTLDGEGSTNATFIFQIGSTLTTASASSVELINGAGACAVFWQVGSSATLGTTTDFQGTIMAMTSITMTTGATIGVGGIGNGGRALARNGALTLDSNVITPPPAGCPFAAAPTPTPVPTATPIPGTAPSVAPSTPPATAPTATDAPGATVPTASVALLGSPSIDSPVPGLPDTSIGAQTAAQVFGVPLLPLAGLALVAGLFLFSASRRSHVTSGCR